MGLLAMFVVLVVMPAVVGFLAGNLIADATDGVGETDEYKAGGTD